jgi:uncharacterized protein with von Willebrand factor type A (vWA) domain
MYSLLSGAASLGIKAIKYLIDSGFRDQVEPVPGSVLYCDLWVAVEHSGIYLGDGKIANIVVDGLAESTVERSGAGGFTSKSMMGRKIYVSCDRNGAVGDVAVAGGADGHVGERAFYGLVFKNCHQFSTRCVNYKPDAADGLLVDRLWSIVPGESWEPTLGLLKEAARKKLGATKWRLWDWERERDARQSPPPEPDWQAHSDFFLHQALDEASIARIRAELAAAQAYEAEIADENIPQSVRLRLAAFRRNLADIAQKYEEVKDFLAACPGAKFSYAELQACDDDFIALAKILQDNARIKELARRMGRDHISEERKKQGRIPQVSRSEIHGTHRSDDVMRILPSELLNLEDETMEVLFYARLLEKNLLSYALQGVTLVDGEISETSRKRTGPVVACLDTSASMQGAPLLKAKALLLAIANLLGQEQRSLHVLLFGSAGEIREFSMDRHNDAAGLLRFLRQGFGGGTDFETPLRRAVEIIGSQQDYKAANILMISDGDCSVSSEFSATLRTQKKILNCMVYSVLCAGSKLDDGFSDATAVL